MAMRFFGVCCTVDMPAKILDEFLKTTYGHTNHEIYMLVIIRNKQETYVEPTYPPVHQRLAESPFQGRTERECFEILRCMHHETKSELNYNWFVTLDERSIKDSTVLLAGYNSEKDCIETVRVAFEIAQSAIASHSAGVGAISEDRENAAKQPDGVLR